MVREKWGFVFFVLFAFFLGRWCFCRILEYVFYRIKFVCNGFFFLENIISKDDSVNLICFYEIELKIRKSIFS